MENKTIEYEIIEEISVEELNKEVNTMISKDWVPLGGVSASLSKNDERQYFIVCQAMIRGQKYENIP